MRCAHYACRCARAAELAELAERTGDTRHLAAAVDVHRLEELVECRELGAPAGRYSELHRRAFEDNERDLEQRDRARRGRHDDTELELELERPGRRDP